MAECRVVMGVAMIMVRSGHPALHFYSEAGLEEERQIFHLSDRSQSDPLVPQGFFEAAFAESEGYGEDQRQTAHRELGRQLESA